MTGATIGRIAVAGAVALMLASGGTRTMAQTGPAVVVTVKPIHALVSGVMAGVGEPTLIVAGSGSPHNYTLKPSQAAAVQDADLIFWIGPELETFFNKPIESLGAKARVVSLIEAPDLLRLPVREGGNFDEHDDHGHAKKDDHGHDEKHEDHDHDHAKKEEHDHGTVDAHIWLDPQNAIAMVHAIEHALHDIDPANTARYEANAEALIARLEALIGELQATLAPVAGKPFVVFHDAYQYLEYRFGLTAIGSITINPEAGPSAERLTEVKHRLQDLDAACVFAEPQFPPQLVAVVTEGGAAGTAVLDPLGAALQPGEDLYFDLMREMAASLKECLSRAN